MRIGTQQFVTLDIVLEVGTLQETITVTADAPLIESTNASVGGVIDAKALEAIPTAGRSVFLMATLEPTVQASGNAHWNRMSTPNSRARSCRICSISMRPMPANPWPSETVRSPRWITAMSSQ